MSERVFLHLGLPKTGTTYLQSILWSHRDALREQGLLLPGFGPRQHLWASGVVREEPRLRRRHEDAPQAWRILLEELRAWPGTGLVTHEFLCGASREQAGRAVADAAGPDGAEVHLVVTARELVALVTARWQEWVKNGASGPIDDYPTTDEHRPADEWGWGTLDLADVLDRWGAHVPPERVHVICPPGPEQPREELWHRFAGVLGLDPTPIDVEGVPSNPSLGVVEVELLRRVTPRLQGFDRPVDRGVWIRGHLAEQTLVGRGGERFWPGADRVAQLRARGEAGLDRVAAAGYDVVGSLDALRTPATLPPRRHPDSVTDAELLDAATRTIADLLGDVRAARGGAEPAGVGSPTVRPPSGWMRGAVRRWQDRDARGARRTDR